jgi:hypothetical protein
MAKLGVPKPIRNVRKWFAELDRLNFEPFMGKGRKQAKMPAGNKADFSHK